MYKKRKEDNSRHPPTEKYKPMSGYPMAVSSVLGYIGDMVKVSRPRNEQARSLNDNSAMRPLVSICILIVDDRLRTYVERSRSLSEAEFCICPYAVKCVWLELKAITPSNSLE